MKMILRRTGIFLSLLVLGFFSFNTSRVLAQGLSADQLKVYSDQIFRFNVKDDSCAAGGSGVVAGVPAGTLPPVIPEPYNGAFTKGANLFHVAPALIAALFTEENFTKTPTSGLAARWANFPKVHPDPNSGWPTNQYHTEGAFQFIPGTWAAYGADGDGDGSKDPQHIADGAAGAANYVAHNGATIDKPPASWQNAIFAYNHAQWYVDAVMMYYNFYNTGGTNTSVTTTPPAATDTSSSSGACASNASVNVNCTPASTDPNTAAPVATTSPASKAVCLAQAELALWKAGTLKPGTDFHKYSQGRGGDWCADFASWIYNQAGYPLKATNQGNVPAVAGIKAIGIAGGKFIWHPRAGYTPQPGDLAIHDLIGSHVNIVISATATSITMIGGNQGNSYSTSSVTQYSASGGDGISGFVSPSQSI